MIRAILLVLIALSVAACGSAATPVWEQPEEEVVNINEEVGGEAVAVVPTNTPEPPTATPTEIPPTATNTPEPPTATPEPTEVVVDDPIVAQVAIGGDEEAGEALFNQMISEVGFACATCHAVADDTVLVGPSLLGIPARAAERVEGQVAERYIHASIIKSNEYIVEGFVENLMPQTYGEILSEADIINIIAYLMTLEG